jgi:endonuclease-3 related protein
MESVQNKICRIYEVLFKRWGPQGWWPAQDAFEVAVGAVLVQNTTWSNVSGVIKKLKDEGLMCSKRLYSLGEEQLSHFIKPSGLPRLKARRLMNFLYFLNKEYDGSMEALKKEPLDSLRTKLLRINGVGEETADAIALYACEKLTFVVDAYTYRILSRHSLVNRRDYKSIKKLFEESLPKDLSTYKEYHALLVRCAKEYCKKKPLCDGCPLQSF